MSSSKLLEEKTSANRTRWLRMDQLPFSRVTAYRLIAQGNIVSVLIKQPGGKTGGRKKGIRLVDANSLDAYLEGLASEQKIKKGVFV